MAPTHYATRNQIWAMCFLIVTAILGMRQQDWASSATARPYKMEFLAFVDGSVYTLTRLMVLTGCFNNAKKPLLHHLRRAKRAAIRPVRMNAGGRTSSRATAAWGFVAAR